ncbi:MAG TPA: type IV pilus twitching motility protein PilT [Stenomitos sp.]
MSDATMTVASSPMAELLRRAHAQGAADVHLKPNQPPKMVLYGKVQPIDPAMRSLTPQEVEQLIFGVVTPKQVEEFRQNLELDTSFEFPGLARFRLNVYRANGQVGAVIRIIPPDIRSVEDLGLPPSIKRLAFERQGLVLVTGPTGSGKTTTLASLIDYVNRNKAGHIVTIEDPIEVTHPTRQSVITQREVGGDTKSFANAVKAALRQAPNIILIGEMRDKETIEMALKAAETGHLVFSTLHTNDAVQSIRRVINAFPPHEQEPVRLQLGNVLKGAIAQRLVPRKDRPGRIPALDLMIVTPTVRDAILKDRIDDIYDLIHNGAYDGMMSMNQSLLHHFKNGVIDYDTAMSYSENPAQLLALMRDALRAIVR